MSIDGNLKRGTFVHAQLPGPFGGGGGGGVLL